VHLMVDADLEKLAIGANSQKTSRGFVSPRSSTGVFEKA
jgi:hypothetical protein